MKKGHRRTNSETITISRPFIQRLEKPIKEENHISEQFCQFKKMKQRPITFSSIQSLLQKSQTNISQRILYIQNLQQPNNSNSTTQDFSFGKGVNFKLSNYKLNMNEIPQVPKSNQSTSLTGQNKVDAIQKELYFTQQPVQFTIYHPHKPIKQSKQISKYSTTTLHQKRTKTSSTVTIKPLNKYDKIQKIQKEKNQSKNTPVILVKQNPLKRPKLQYQTHKKNVHSFGGGFTGNNFGIKVNKDFKEYGGYETIGSNLAHQEPKKKKKNLVV